MEYSVYTSEEVDALLLAASQEYETQPTTSARASKTTSPAPTDTTTTTRFAPPKTNADIERGRIDSVPKKTQQDTKYCCKLWDSWREYRQSIAPENIPLLRDMTTEEINHWLSRFVVEARKTDGSEYPPNTLHHIVAGLQRYLRFQGRTVDLFKDRVFAPLQASLDGEMKRLQAKGV